MKITRINKITDECWRLFLLADPNKTIVSSYLTKGKTYVLSEEKKTIGLIHLIPHNNKLIEIKNIAINEKYQNKGLGKKLIEFAEQKAKKEGYSTIRICTGNSSIKQLALYQKRGFDIKLIDFDFFTNNYKGKITENGIECKHLIILEKELTV